MVRSAAAFSTKARRIAEAMLLFEHSCILIQIFLREAGFRADPSSSDVVTRERSPSAKGGNWNLRRGDSGISAEASLGTIEK